MRFATLCLLGLGLVSCARHPLSGSWHEVKWHQQRTQGVVYGANAYYEGTPLVADLSPAYADACLKQFAYDLKEASGEHLAMLTSAGPQLTAEVTRALRETGSAFVIVGTESTEYFKLLLMTDKNENYDLTCSSPFHLVYCRYAQEFCGSADALKSLGKSAK